jgi:hypothetical protein
LKDFQPDYFSVTSIEFPSIPLNDLRETENILKVHFPLVGRILGAKNLSGLGINSSNIKIISETGDYVLKYWSSKDLNKINQICRILLHLNSEGISAPIPITTIKNKFTFEFENRTVTLFNYLDGEIFKPNVSDLQSYFASTSKLFISLGKFNDNSKYHSLNLDTELISNTLNQILKNNSFELAVKLQDDFINLKAIHKKLLLDLKKYSTTIHNTEKQFSHYDLHPRNILKLRKHNYAFLDFESCIFSDPNIAWGFTLIKILREVMARSQVILDPIEVGKTTLDLIQNQEFADKLIVSLLPVFGRVEIMRRLTYIINDLINYNSKTWLSMLPIQVQLLRESYILFP